MVSSCWVCSIVGRKAPCSFLVFAAGLSIHLNDTTRTWIGTAVAKASRTRKLDHLIQESHVEKSIRTIGKSDHGRTPVRARPTMSDLSRAIFPPNVEWLQRLSEERKRCTKLIASGRDPCTASWAGLARMGFDYRREIRRTSLTARVCAPRTSVDDGDGGTERVDIPVRRGHVGVRIAFRPAPRVRLGIAQRTATLSHQIPV